ncbi:MAG: DUF3822 family protein [Bacteroidales bacterium]
MSNPLECILHKVDPQFAASQGFRYRLSVLLAPDGFSFLVTHANTQKILSISVYKTGMVSGQSDETIGWPTKSDNYFELLRKVEIVEQHFLRTDIAIASHKINVFPYAFSEEGQAEKLMSAAHFKNEGEEILSEEITNGGAVAAILVPKYIKQNCETIFPGANLHCAATVMAKGLLHKHPTTNLRQVFVNLQNRYFELVVVQGPNLLYLNAFKYTEPSDVLYFVVFALELLGLTPTDETITLLGDFSESTPILTQLKLYCASLVFVEKPDELEYGDVLSGIPFHKYFTLLNIPICE